MGTMTMPNYNLRGLRLSAPLVKPIRGLENRDKVFMATAIQIGQESTCPKAQVGAVLVQTNTIIRTGANGTPCGVPSCEAEGCVVIPATETAREYSRHLHAEARVIASCAREGIRTLGTRLYVSLPCCLDCARLVCEAGIATVVIPRHDEVWASTVGDYLDKGGVEIVQLD